MNSKPGIRTTEFWLAIVAMVLVNLPQVFVENPPQWVTVAGLIGSALIAMGYGIGRSLTKSSEGGGMILPLNAPMNIVPPAEVGDGGKTFSES